MLYTLLTAKVDMWQWEKHLASLLMWMNAYLVTFFCGVTALKPLYMDYHITIGSQSVLCKILLTSNPFSTQENIII